MNLNEQLSALDLEHQTNHLSAEDIIPMIDLTLLDEQASAEDIQKIATQAQDNQVAAICVYPQHLDFISPFIPIKRATVVNFPYGNQPRQDIINDIELLINSDGVDEIDYVFPYNDYLLGKRSEAINQCHEIFSLCKNNDLTFKVIIESGALPSMEVIYEMSSDIIKSGCDFLKTSTGKQPIGATIPAVFAMLAAIKDNHCACGIKISGGISTPQQALDYMQLTQLMLNRTLDNQNFRIGSSQLINNIRAMFDH